MSVIQERFRDLTIPQLRNLIREGEDVQELFKSTAFRLIGTDIGRIFFKELVKNYDVGLEVSW